MAKTYGKNRGWEGTLYPEHMIEDWQQKIAQLVQLPYAYCVHDKDVVFDKDEPRKAHVHLMIVWEGPTTQKHAREVFRQLNGESEACPLGIRPVYSYQRMYDYLIHDTEDAREAGKHQYSPDERKTGNGFDIGALVQIGAADKKRMRRDLAHLIIDSDITNYRDFQILAWDTFAEEIDLLDEVSGIYSAYFERLIKGNYQKKVTDIAMQKTVVDICERYKKLWIEEALKDGKDEQGRDRSL